MAVRATNIGTKSRNYAQTGRTSAQTGSVWMERGLFGQGTDDGVSVLQAFGQGNRIAFNPRADFFGSNYAALVLGGSTFASILGTDSLILNIGGFKETAEPTDNCIINFSGIQRVNFTPPANSGIPISTFDALTGNWSFGDLTDLGFRVQAIGTAANGTFLSKGGSDTGANFRVENLSGLNPLIYSNEGVFEVLSNQKRHRFGSIFIDDRGADRIIEAVNGLSIGATNGIGKISIRENGFLYANNFRIAPDQNNLQPGSGGIFFEGRSASPSFQRIIAKRYRNDSDKSFEIGTEDIPFAKPIDLFIYAGSATDRQGVINIGINKDGGSLSRTVFGPGTDNGTALAQIFGTTTIGKTIAQDIAAGELYTLLTLGRAGYNLSGAAPQLKFLETAQPLDVAIGTTNALIRGWYYNPSITDNGTNTTHYVLDAEKGSIRLAEGHFLTNGFLQTGSVNGNGSLALKFGTIQPQGLPTLDNQYLEIEDGNGNVYKVALLN